jgi:hypothetical protein
MRKLFGVILLLALTAAAAYVGAGWLPPPVIAIAGPERFVGLATPLDVTVDAPGALSSLRIAFEQQGSETTVFSLEGEGASVETMPDGSTRVRVGRTIGREAIPGLQPGAGRIVVMAARPVLYGLRELAASTVRDVEVRLEPPRISVLSTHHFVNQGGTEAVVYRVTPEDVYSGVRVGDREYPGYQASATRVPGASIDDRAVRIAFFALRHDQGPDTPFRLFARDEAGNSASATFEYRVFPRPMRRSRFELDDRFLERVVPAIVEADPDVAGDGALIDRFVRINSELRRRNAETIASFAGQTAPELLWRGEVFHPFTNTAVESPFADQRTYFYQGREVDRQVHLGFDLASYANTPIVAANRGTVLFAAPLGIYGQCVIVDHGMGVQSLYAHLSGIDVAPGAVVEKGQTLGRSGMTGLAGGDHLHFTMLVNGQMVNPIEWWDAHWIEDRILRKLRDASGIHQ